MSRVVALLAVAVCVVTLVAAEARAALSPERITELLQTDIAVKKAEMMSRASQLSRTESEAFWPLYWSYEREMGQLDGRTARLIEEYKESYRTLDDAKAQALLDRLFELHEQRLVLLRRYAAQLRAKLPMRHVAGFVLTEFQLLQRLDLQWTADLGLIR
jgi:hypothetical protein